MIAKKIISAFTAIVMILTATPVFTMPSNATTVPEPMFKQGDVDGNGTITTADAFEILMYLAKIPQSCIFNDDNAYNAACIVGEEPTLSDALEILMYLVGMGNMISDDKYVEDVADAGIDYDVLEYKWTMGRFMEGLYLPESPIVIDSLSELYALIENTEGRENADKYVPVGVNEKLFGNKALLVVYSTFGTSSRYTAVDNIVIDDGVLKVNTTTKKPCVENADMSYCRIILSVKREEINGISEAVRTDNFIQCDYDYSGGDIIIHSTCKNEMSNWHARWTGAKIKIGGAEPPPVYDEITDIDYDVLEYKWIHGAYTRDSAGSIYRIDSLSELHSLVGDYSPLDVDFEISEEYFENKVLLVIYSTSGTSLRYTAVDNIVKEDGVLKVSTTTKMPYTVTADMARLRIILSVDREKINGIGETVSLTENVILCGFSEIYEWHTAWLADKKVVVEAKTDDGIPGIDFKLLGSTWVPSHGYGSDDRWVPISRIDSLSELYSLIENAEGCRFTKCICSYHDIENYAPKGIDDAFFEDKVLLVIYSAEGSSSKSTSVDKIIKEDGSLKVSTTTTIPGLATCDLARQRIIVAVDREEVGDIGKEVSVADRLVQLGLF